MTQHLVHALTVLNERNPKWEFRAWEHGFPVFVVRFPDGIEAKICRESLMIRDSETDQLVYQSGKQSDDPTYVARLYAALVEEAKYQAKTAKERSQWEVRRKF
jgi:hypothetical protein